MNLFLAMLMLAAGDATTIVVENETPRAMMLRRAAMPEHFNGPPKAALAPRTSTRLASTKGKIFVPHQLSSAEAVQLHYADESGNGCLFRIAATDHSPSWKKMKPRAESIGNAVCKARTGQTIGDFVYTVR